MRTRLVTLSLFAILAVSTTACGGGGSSSDGAKTTDGGGSGAATTTTTASSDSGSSGGGKVDCASLNTAAQQLLSIQLLAQLRDPETVADIKAGTIGNLDIDSFISSMKTLHALDGYHGSLGNAKDAIDAYEQAGTEAKALLDANPPTQASIDAYQKDIGSTATFIGHQTAIVGALADAGC